MYPLDFVSIMSERMTGAYDTSMVTVHPYTLQVPLPTLIGDTEYQAPIAVTIIFIDTVAFDEERTRNDCVTVVDGVESVTGDTQHVADAFATAALHAGGEEKTPDGNLVDPTLAKKMSVV